MLGLIGAAGLVFSLGTPCSSLAQTAAAAAPVVATGDYVFRAPTALLLFHVRPDHTQTFEGIIGRLAQGLDSATDAIRRQQRSGWKVFRSTESSAGTAVYVLMADPVVAGADYDPVRMLSELLPGESQGLYEQLKAAVLKIERMELARLR